MTTSKATEDLDVRNAIPQKPITKEDILEHVKKFLKPDHEIYVKEKTLYIHEEDLKKITIDFALQSLTHEDFFLLKFKVFKSDDEMMWDVILKPEEFK